MTLTAASMNAAGPSASTISLAIVGAAVQFLGILLVASPDLVPGARWTARRIRIIVNKIERVVRKALRLPPRSIHAQANPVGALKFGGRATSIKGTSATTLNEKVEWLLRRDQEAQRDFNDLAARVGDLASDVTQLLDALREELRGEIASKIAAAQADLRVVRIVGTALLIIGLVLTTIAALQ